jgi:hypothetical protein
VPLPREAVIVRGGLSSVATLRDNAEDTHQHDAVWGVSAWVALDGEVKNLLEELGDQLPHRRIRTTTVRTLEDSGFPVEETPPAHHVTIHLGESPTDETFSRLEALFGPPTVRP